MCHGVQFLAMGAFQTSRGLERSSGGGQNSEDFAKFQDYVNLFSANTLNSFDRFFQFTCICCHLGVSMDCWDQICQEGDGYDLNDNLKTWNEVQKSQQERENCLGWKLIYEWAYESNPQAKKALDRKYEPDVFLEGGKESTTIDPYMISNSEVAKYFVSKYDKDFIVNFDDKHYQLYYWTGDLWTKDKSIAIVSTLLAQDVYKELHENINRRYRSRQDLCDLLKKLTILD